MGSVGKIFSLILVVSFCLVANSASAFLGADFKLSIFANGVLVQKASVIGTDDRLTFEAYAASKGLSLRKVEKMFGATGILNCDEFQITAQLTGSRSVITTAGHLFFENDCSSKNRKVCAFFLVRNGEYIQYNVRMTSIQFSNCNSAAPGADWAVMELERAAPADVSPYKVPVASPNLAKNFNILQVSGYSHNFQVDGKMPRYISECSARDISQSPSLIQTDCDSGPGASGSALLQASDDGGMVMVGMHLGAWGTNGDIDGLPYVPNKSSNLSIPVDGDLKLAVKSAVSNSAARLGSPKNAVKGGL